jgi:L-ascorbate metabolism protein UlaG (beta-lactamase superfamily)
VTWLTLVRNATLLLETGDRRILVDPMLRAAGTSPPIERSREPAVATEPARSWSSAGP